MAYQQGWMNGSTGTEFLLPGAHHRGGPTREQGETGAEAGAGISCTSLSMAGDACRSLAPPWSLMPGKPRSYGGTCGQHTTVML